MEEAVLDLTDNVVSKGRWIRMLFHMLFALLYDSLITFFFSLMWFVPFQDFYYFLRHESEASSSAGLKQPLGARHLKKTAPASLEEVMNGPIREKLSIIPDSVLYAKEKNISTLILLYFSGISFFYSFHLFGSVDGVSCVFPVFLMLSLGRWIEDLCGSTPD